MFRKILILAALLLAPAPAMAWWEYGHETVARIALLNVRPETRAKIAGLLQKQGLLETPTCSARTIEEASVWPDCIKPLDDRFSYASSWHYQNVDVCKPFDQKSACKDGNCVSAQIERNAKLLGDPKVPERERVMALAFLVHFVGDLHMPLHAGDRGDLGGNRVKAAYGLIEGRTNLHSVWDGYLAERAISTPAGGAEGLLSGTTPEARAAMAAGSVEDWARENWGVARDYAYGMKGEPCGPVSDERVHVEEADTVRLIPVVRDQVLKGGLRLARMLDEALG
ncbi:S1/P1 nuclease [Allosphingosinicella flava]|uniref:S1/P1 nuclease n=1 Tax=Allosphingosinicella flava TaxID=2771430 RepID=A0A7T2GJ71_9SPHN|nr:S1/P1 nuclease [Sphingosinicella flava]QPQ54737.1 S1/P1 nuclease [Sphingosinicella flava]